MTIIASFSESQRAVHIIHQGCGSKARCPGGDMYLVVHGEKMFTWNVNKGLVLLQDLWRSGNHSEQQCGAKEICAESLG